jgi:hypothetical protein
MTETSQHHRLVYVKAADLDRWQCRPLGTIEILDLEDRPVGRLDGVVIDRDADRPLYLAVRPATDNERLTPFLVPVGDAWFDETARAVRIDAPRRERIRFDPDEFERMSPDQAVEYERRVLAACCPEVGFRRDGRPDYGPHELFKCPAWLRPPVHEQSAESQSAESHRANRTT